MEQIPLIINSFLAYKETIQNCSPLTVKEYYNDLRTFFRYIIASRNGKDLTELERIDTSQVDESLAGSVTAIKAFYKYHTKKSKKLNENPTKDIDSPAVKQALPKYLSLEESLRLLDSVDKSNRTYERDYCIITLFLNCGMRLSELVGINLTDISDDMSKLVVTGKGSKMRNIYLNSACRDALQAYLKVRAKAAMEKGRPILDKNALFLSGKNRRISNKTVQWLIKKQLAESGLAGKGYSVHKLRHTAATLMYNSGNVDVRALKDILGHEQLNTTQIYTHVSDKKLEEAMESNPLAKKKQ